MNTVNPQKDLVKKICTTMYYLGLGNVWYEDLPRSNLHKILYKVWFVVANIYLFTVTTNEFLAYLRPNLNEKEQNDLAQFCIGHFCLSSKIVCAYLKRKEIVVVLRRLLEGSRSMFVDAEADMACVKKSIKLCLVVIVITYFTILSATIDGIKAHFTEGIPIRTEITYYPQQTDHGTYVNVLRFFIQLHWWFLGSTMLAIDSLCISSLVIVEYKFKVLQIYYQTLREKYLTKAEEKTEEVLADDFRHDFVVGIKMHDDALWCANNVQSALGLLYSVQVFEGVLMLAMCLLKLVSEKRNLVFLLANLAYIACVVSLTGAYMLAAGDITHEAAEVCTAMFHCGWELVPVQIRTLAVLAIQRSQVPVYMFAFGILTLSYDNFISVMRSSYSFFAVMY